jgi:hypothetical protein
MIIYAYNTLLEVNMWECTFSKIYHGVTKEEVWRTYTDIKNWPKWDKGLEYCDMRDEFINGANFILKLKDGPKFKITLYDVVPTERFSDYCKFPGAKMHDVHLFEEVTGGVKLTNTIFVTGILSFLWVKLVAKNVAASVPAQTDAMIEYLRQRNG